jgi:hypothetical protein
MLKFTNWRRWLSHKRSKVGLTRFLY